MSALAIILIVVAAVLVVLFAGGLVANGRRRHASSGRLHEQLKTADSALAAARAQDKGWERETIERAARTAFAERRPGEQISELQIIQVIDKPGTDADLAVLRVVTAGGPDEIVTLGRRDGVWVSAEAL